MSDRIALKLAGPARTPLSFVGQFNPRQDTEGDLPLRARHDAYGPVVAVRPGTGEPAGPRMHASSEVLVLANMVA